MYTTFQRMRHQSYTTPTVMQPTNHSQNGVGGSVDKG